MSENKRESWMPNGEALAESVRSIRALDRPHEGMEQLRARIRSAVKKATKRARLEAKIEALMEFRVEVGNDTGIDAALALWLDEYRAQLAALDAKEGK